MFTQATLAAILAVAAIGFADAAQARGAQSSDPDTVSVRVKYQDLDLSSDAGAHAMLQRIRLAAKEICGPSEDGFEMRRLYDQCVKTTVDRAVVQFKNPRVIALASGKTSSAPLTVASLPR